MKSILSLCAAVTIFGMHPYPSTLCTLDFRQPLRCAPRIPITEAYLHEDPKKDWHYNNSRSFTNQVFDVRIRASKGAPHLGSRTYVTDMHYEGGLIIWYSDPDATITVLALDGEDRGTFLRLAPIEYAPTYRIIYTDRSEIGRVFVTITSPHIHRRFSIGLFRYFFDPT